MVVGVLSDLRWSYVAHLGTLRDSTAPLVQRVVLEVSTSRSISRTPRCPIMLLNLASCLMKHILSNVKEHLRQWLPLNLRLNPQREVEVLLPMSLMYLAFYALKQYTVIFLLR